MFVTETQVRVHYALTDQMGFVYYGNYPQFYEIGRNEAIRSLGFTYKDIEAMGIITPVVDLHIRYLRPARYDDLLTIRTTLKQMPEEHKVVFHTDIYNQQDEWLNSGNTTLLFLDARLHQKTTIPAELRSRLQPYFGTPDAGKTGKN